MKMIDGKLVPDDFEVPDPNASTDSKALEESILKALEDEKNALDTTKLNEQVEVEFPVPFPTYYLTKEKLLMIESTLKTKGLDSQQLVNAMSEIKSILEY